MAEIAEVVNTIDRLDRELTELVLRGLRAVGPQHLTALKGLGEEFTRIGAVHLAERIATLVAAIGADDRKSAEALLRTQTSLRVFERLLTVRTARGMFASLPEEETE